MVDRVVGGGLTWLSCMLCMCVCWAAFGMVACVSVCVCGGGGFLGSISVPLEAGVMVPVHAVVTSLGPCVCVERGLRADAPGTSTRASSTSLCLASLT